MIRFVLAVPCAALVSGALLLGSGASGAATVSAPRAAAAAHPTVTVSPSRARRGQTVVISGRGWARSAVVQLLIGPPRSEAYPFGRVRTTRTGTFRRAVRLPRPDPGPYVVLACRRSCRVKASARLTITG